MAKKRLLALENDPFWLEEMESRTMLSLAPVELPITDVDVPVELPDAVQTGDMVPGPASSHADGGLDSAAEQVPDAVDKLPEATRAPAEPDKHGAPDDLLSPDDAPSPDDIPSPDDAPPYDPASPTDDKPGTRSPASDDTGPPEDVVRGPASINAADGLANAAGNVPDHVTLPEPTRAPPEGGQGPPEDVVPGPASVNAADGLANAAENVPDHVTLPEPTRTPPEGGQGPPEDVEPGPASVNAADGLANAAGNVPEHVTLPEPTREPADIESR